MNNTGITPVVPTLAFVSAMEEHWTTTLGNASSPALRAVWAQMGKTFDSCLINDTHSSWQVLQPPTGSGKTQGSTLYCALVAKAKDEAKAGILYVTRQKAEADAIAATINAHADAKISRAHHSDSPLRSDQLQETQVLIITQAALTLAMGNLRKDRATRWFDFIQWDHGKRRLIIVDEALAGIVEQSQVNLQSLGYILGLAKPLASEFNAEVQALEALYAALEARSHPKAQPPTSDIMWNGAPSDLLCLPPEFDLYGLGLRLKSAELDRLVVGTKSEVDQRHVAQRVADTLRHADALLRRWAFYQRKGDYHTLNSALLLIPDEAPPVVVLDATASQSELWEVLGDRVSILPVPEGARRYDNFTLHLARARGMGKHNMVAKADTRLARLFADLEPRLGVDRKVLLCTHKALKAKAISYGPQNGGFAYATWGDIDGKNDWQDNEAVVLFGLLYMDEAWAKGLVGATSTANLGDTQGPDAKDRDLYRRLQQRQLSVSIIQALNRVRCRKVIDAQGNCAPVDAYLVLPPGPEGDAILAAIRAEMPGLQVKAWDFSPDGAKARVRRGSFHSAIVAYMAAEQAGIVYLKTLQTELGIPKLKPIRDALNDAANALSRALADIGVSYVRDGSGPATKTYLLKSAI